MRACILHKTENDEAEVYLTEMVFYFVRHNDINNDIALINVKAVRSILMRDLNGFILRYYSFLSQSKASQW